VAAAASGASLACCCGAPACSLLQRLRPRATYCLLHQSSISESSHCAWLFLFSLRPRRSPTVAELLVWVRVCALETYPRDISLFSFRPCNDQSGIVITIRSHRLSSIGAGRFCIYVSAMSLPRVDVRFDIHVAGRTRVKKLQVLGWEGGTLFLEGTGQSHAHPTHDSHIASRLVRVFLPSCRQAMLLT
jgi:hypothetical protein